MSKFLNSTRTYVTDSNLTPTRVKQVKTILRGAKKVLQNKGWVKKSEAVNKYRKPVDSESPNAVRFCAIGAMVHKTKTTKASHEALVLAERILGVAINPETFWPVNAIVDFNDNPSTTKEAVLSKLDEAIAAFDADTKALTSSTPTLSPNFY